MVVDELVCCDGKGAGGDGSNAVVFVLAVDFLRLGVVVTFLALAFFPRPIEAVNHKTNFRGCIL